MSDDNKGQQEDMFFSNEAEDQASRRDAGDDEDVSHGSQSEASSHDHASHDGDDHHEVVDGEQTAGAQGDFGVQNTTHGHDLAGFVFGALDEEETARVRAAIAADPALRAEVQEMESVLTEFALLAPSQQINRGRSAGIRSRLIARAASTRDGRLPTARQTLDSAKSQVPIVESGALSTRKTGQGDRVVGGTSASSGSTTSGSTTRGGSSYMGAGSPELSDLRAGTQPLGRVEVSRTTTPAGHATLAPSKPQPVRRSGAIRGGVWLTLALVLAAIVGGLQEWRMRQAQNQLRLSLASRDSSLTTQVASLEASILQKDSLIETLIGPNMKVVNMMSSAAQDPVVRMFWDQKTHEWTMRAYKLRPPRSGRTYQVWLIANNAPKPISAGTFMPDAQGNAMMQAKYKMPKDALVQVAVSEEPMGGMPEPTGPIIVAGR